MSCTLGYLLVLYIEYDNYNFVLYPLPFSVLIPNVMLALPRSACVMLSQIQGDNQLQQPRTKYTRYQQYVSAQYRIFKDRKACTRCVVIRGLHGYHQMRVRQVSATTPHLSKEEVYLLFGEIYRAVIVII